MAKIVIDTEGGLIQTILTDIRGLEVLIVNRDVEGADEDEVHEVTLADGAIEVILDRSEATLDQEEVASLFTQAAQILGTEDNGEPPAVKPEEEEPKVKGESKSKLSDVDVAINDLLE